MLFERLMLAASQIGGIPPVTGSLYSWGINTSAQTGQGTTTGTTTIPTVMSGTTGNWLKISAATLPPSGFGGGNAGCATALKSDGTLWSWGNNAGVGIIGQGGATNVLAATKIGVATDWADIAQGSSGGLAVKTNGTLWSWGFDINGSLGKGSGGANSGSPVQVGVATTWSKVFTASSVTFLIDTSGQLWTMGTPSGYEDGLNSPGAVNLTPTQVGVATNWKQLCTAGQQANTGTLPFTIGLRTDGTLWSAGSNINGQTGQGTTAGNTTTFTQIGVATDWLSIGAMSSYINGGGTVFGSGFAIKTNNTLYGWGALETNGLGGSGATVPTQIGSDNTWIAVTGGSTGGNTAPSGTQHVGYGLGLKSDGTMWSWGNNTDSQAGQGTNTIGTFPSQIDFTNAYSLIGAGGAQTTGVSAFGVAMRNGALATTNLYSFGDNSGGTTAQATTTGTVLVPTKAADNHSNWTKIAVAVSTSPSIGSPAYGILSNGTLWSWGNNHVGGAGTGSAAQGLNSNNYTSPTQVGSNNTWTEVSGGPYGGLAVRSGGTLWGWGLDQFGEYGLGGGSTIQGSPTQSGVATTWLKVFCGYATSFVIDTSGGLWALGSNTNYRTGRGINTGNTTTITQILGATNWVHVAVGFYGAIGIRSDGTAWSWGTDIAGELCQGSTGGVYTTPTQIGVGTNWVYAAADNIGGNRSFLIQDIAGVRTLWTAGSNSNYGTGLGINTSNTTVLTQVGVATDWQKVVCLNNAGATAAAGMGIKTGGSVWSWGSNALGQTAQGTAAGTTNNPTAITGTWSYLADTKCTSLSFLLP